MRWPDVHQVEGGSNINCKSWDWTDRTHLPAASMSECTSRPTTSPFASIHLVGGAAANLARARSIVAGDDTPLQRLPDDTRQLADDAAAECQHAHHEDCPLHDGDPRAEP